MDIGKRRPLTEIRTKTVCDKAGAVTLRGELPVCIGKRLPSRYYQRVEQELRQRCEALAAPGELLLRTELYAPRETLCSVHVEARLRVRGRILPFFTDGCVWDLRSGMPLRFRELTGSRFSVRRLWPGLEPRQEPEWLLRSFPGWEDAMKRALSRYRFYLEPDALVLYLPAKLQTALPDRYCRLRFSVK